MFMTSIQFNTNSDLVDCPFKKKPHMVINQPKSAQGPSKPVDITTCDNNSLIHIIRNFIAKFQSPCKQLYQLIQLRQMYH